jgi:hypothetical protein
MVHRHSVFEGMHKETLGGWITWSGSIAEADATKIIQHAFKKGINLFDPADIYSAGQSEVLLGQAIRGIPCEELVITTKLRGRTMQGENRQGLSRKHIMESITRSLTRLGLDYVDLDQCHSWHPTTPLEETKAALNDLVRKGKTLYLGCSNFNPGPVRAAATENVSCRPALRTAPSHRRTQAQAGHGFQTQGHRGLRACGHEAGSRTAKAEDGSGGGVGERHEPAPAYAATAVAGRPAASLHAPAQCGVQRDASSDHVLLDPGPHLVSGRAGQFRGGTVSHVVPNLDPRLAQAFWESRASVPLRPALHDQRATRTTTGAQPVGGVARDAGRLSRCAAHRHGRHGGLGRKRGSNAIQ